MIRKYVGQVSFECEGTLNECDKMEKVVRRGVRFGLVMSEYDIGLNINPNLGTFHTEVNNADRA